MATSGPSVRGASASKPAAKAESPALPAYQKLERSNTVRTVDTTPPKRPRYDSIAWKIPSSYHLHEESYFQSIDPSQEYEVEEKPKFGQAFGGDDDLEAVLVPKGPQARRKSIKELFKEPLPPEDDHMPILRRKSTVKSVRGDHIVCWKGETDPEDPKNWKTGRKWAATVLVSLFTFMAPLSSSMIAPCLDQMAKDLDVTNQLEKTLMLSIFILAFALGPLIFGPLSEIYGRVRVVQATNTFYLIFNIAGGFAQNSAQMMAFRFFAGFGGSAVSAIGNGVLGDCWRSDQRGKAGAAYSFAPLIGPALGPIAGGYIAARMSWRWVFFISSFADVAIQLIGIFFLQETYAPILLNKKANKLRKTTGDEKYISEYELGDEALPHKLALALIRPIKLLATQPIVQVLAVFQAYVYGMTFIVYATFPTLWTQRYGQSMSTSGLHYIAPSIGFLIGTQILGRVNDIIYRRLTIRYNGETRPEYRAPIAVPGTLFIMIGLFWYGWSAQARLFWLVPDVGITIFSLGCDVIFQCTGSYVIDCYGRYAASAFAAVVLLRSLCAFGFPLFAQAMYDSLGYGWGNSILAFVTIFLGVPAPFALWKWGPSLRARSTYASDKI